MARTRRIRLSSWNEAAWAGYTAREYIERVTRSSEAFLTGWLMDYRSLTFVPSP